LQQRTFWLVIYYDDLIMMMIMIIMIMIMIMMIILIVQSFALSDKAFPTHWTRTLTNNVTVLNVLTPRSTQFIQSQSCLSNQTQRQARRSYPEWAAVARAGIIFSPPARLNVPHSLAPRRANSRGQPSGHGPVLALFFRRKVKSGPDEGKVPENLNAGGAGSDYISRPIS
jgi:hypothetical protein